MLTRVEKQFLYQKYIKKGYSSYDASKKIKDFVLYLQEIHQKLTKQKKTKEEISQRFKREFEKLCQKLDVDVL